MYIDEVASKYLCVYGGVDVVYMDVNGCVHSCIKRIDEQVDGGRLVSLAN